MKKVRSRKKEKKLLKQYKTRPALWYLNVAPEEIADKSSCADNP